MTILVGDVGGTHTRLALFDGALGEPDVYLTDAAVPLETLIDAFLVKHAASVDRAAFGVAAAVGSGRSVESTNLPWPVDAASVARASRVDWAVLVNDVEACAHGVALLEPTELATLNAGLPHATGTRVVISVGTGLGQAGLYWDGERHHVVAGEGGYTDFAPRTALEEGLRTWLAEQYGHVSYERVCSGRGLVDIHRYLSGEAAKPKDVTERALELMVSVLGAFAGNVALTFLATGGVYLAGGIPGRILPRLETGRFLDAFVDKGLLGPVLAEIPVHVITSDRAALLGAARLASE